MFFPFLLFTDEWPQCLHLLPKALVLFPYLLIFFLRLVRIYQRRLWVMSSLYELVLGSLKQTFFTINLSAIFDDAHVLPFDVLQSLFLKLAL